MNFKFENLPINIFKEGDMYVAICSLLDISGYGNTIDKAKESFTIVFEETMNYLIENDLLVKDLEEHRSYKSAVAGSNPAISTNKKLNNFFGGYKQQYLGINIWKVTNSDKN